MSVVVVGSVALDTVETPVGRNDEGLGGAATYFSLAAANYGPVHLVGVVGEDFPDAHIALLERRGINLDGLERAPGKTFRWAGRYHEDVNQRDTLDTQLNVFQDFHPKLPPAARTAPYLFLANIHPSLQLEVLDQTSAKFVGLDTMNLWIHTALDDLKAVLKRVDVVIINDFEVRDLTGEKNVIKGARAMRAFGPRIVVVKKGEHGSLLLEDGRFFAAPAYPLEYVADPTGAGDSFAGGFMGHIAQVGSRFRATERPSSSSAAIDSHTLREAVIHGTVVASFTCEKFGVERLAEITPPEITKRYQAIHDLVQF